MPSSTPSLQQVATAAGVSLMTVSRALRNHPEIAAATRDRIVALAEKIGYRTDPFVSRAMSRARKGRANTAAESVALVWPHNLTPSDRANPRRQRLLAGVRSRAALLGMAPQEFELDGLRVTPARLSRTLFNRGVRALLLLPAFPYPSGEPAFTWDFFCAATIGYGPMAERLHRASHDHFDAMRIALSKLSSAGHKRIAALVDPVIDNFVQRKYSAAFMAHAPIGTDGLWDRDQKDPAPIAKWWKAGRFDALIVHNDLAPELRARLNIPSSSIVSLHWLAESGVAGMDQTPERVAEAAIDIIMGQLMRNEKGLPAHPRTLLVPGEWRDATLHRSVS